MTFKEFLQEKKKHSKAEAEYVAHPVRGEACKHCTMWREPNQCTAVAGSIDPDGWCKWYKRTHRKNLTEAVTPIDVLQTALDTIGFVPEVGSFANAANTIISTLRAALAKEKDEKKKHIINAGISAVGVIPFAGLINLLKLRKVKPVAKITVQGARALKAYGKTQQAIGNRFNSVTEKSIHDPVHPGILKRQIKGKVTCAKARALKARQKNKGNATAKAANRFQNYHCQ